MTKRKNEYGVKYLVMCPVFNIIDPATQGQLSLKSTVEFYPDEYLPEFVEIQNEIRLKFERKTMPIEAATDELIDLFNEFDPNGIKVKIEVINNVSFFPVTVFAESGLVSSIEVDKKKERGLFKKEKEAGK